MAIDLLLKFFCKLGKISAEIRWNNFIIWTDSRLTSQLSQTIRINSMPINTVSEHSKIGSSTNRSFGLVFAAFFLILALWPLLYQHEMRLWALVLAVIFLLLALVIPKLLAPLNRIWTSLGMLLHNIVSPVALGILFFGVVMPTGLLMRLFGKDPLRLRLDKAANSYWIQRSPSEPTPESLKLPF